MITSEIVVATKAQDASLADRNHVAYPVVDPQDPAKWSTRVDGSPVVNFLFLNSNHHIEHHYFPRVTLYSLPALNRGLRPFWGRIGHPNRSYPALVWGWFVRNGAPHTDWTDLA